MRSVNMIFHATLIYLIAAIALTIALHHSLHQAVSEIYRVAVAITTVVATHESKVLLLLIPLIWWMRHLMPSARLRSTLIISAAAILLQIGFFFIKSAIPRIVPFYADPFFAELDRVILMGNDAWELAHAMTPTILAGWFTLIYSTVWTTLVFAFPIVVVASDPDASRVNRYIGLFFLSWIIVGNVLALVGSSVGPVYYDQLLGTDRFSGMRQSFDLIGYSATPMAELQATLWKNSGDWVSFISAFPSMHVAIAVICAIYIRERFSRFRLIGDAFFALILLISVYSGYHYLLDGLVSLAVVLALNAALRRILDPGKFDHPAVGSDGDVTKSA